jgi:hypothetical protein
MKKKWLMAGGAIGISGAVMLTTGFTALAGTSGYEDYKAALKATQALKSVSVQADAVLQDNGTVLNKTHGDFKISLPDELSSGSVNVSGPDGQQTVALYSGPTGEVWKSNVSDTYYVKTDKQDEKDGQDKEEQDGGGNSDWMNNQAETVIDALVGHLKNEVQVSSQSDGSKQISLQLDNAQIPAIVQALAPLAFKQLSEEHQRPDTQDNGTAGQDPEHLLGSSLAGLKNLSLTQNIQIQNVSLIANVSAGGNIDHQQAGITFTGKDASGVSHTLTLNVDIHLSGFDSTTPDTIDLTGKQVQQVKDDHEGRHHGDSNE